MSQSTHEEEFRGTYIPIKNKELKDLVIQAQSEAFRIGQKNSHNDNCTLTSFDKEVDTILSKLDTTLQAELEGLIGEVGEVEKDYDENESLYDVGQSVNYGINRERSRIRAIAKARLEKLQGKQKNV